MWLGSSGCEFMEVIDLLGPPTVKVLHSPHIPGVMLLVHISIFPLLFLQISCNFAHSSLPLHVTLAGLAGVVIIIVRLDSYMRLRSMGSRRQIRVG